MHQNSFPRPLPGGKQFYPQINAPATDLSPEYNNAYDTGVTRVFARMFERAAEPLNEHIYGPITENNRLLGMFVANATLTAPRLLEPLAGEKYRKHLEAGHSLRAFGYLAIKAGLKLLDGIDGPVTRANSITSEFGGGFDGFTDMVGTYDDGVRIKQAHNLLGISDPVTESIINVRAMEDIGAAVLNLRNANVTRKLSKNGIDVPRQDQPRANAAAKAKFFLSTIGDAITLLGTISKRPERQKKFKKVGVTILAGSAVAGVVSLVQYHRSLRRNIALFNKSEDTTELDESILSTSIDTI